MHVTGRLAILGAVLAPWSTSAWSDSAPTSAGGQEIKGAVIVFDADTRRFAPQPAMLPAGRSVTLLVKNVNTFREKYTLIFKTEDRHNASVPNALAGLIVKTSPAFGGA